MADGSAMYELKKTDFLLCISRKLPNFASWKCGSSSVGRASASQAEGRGFEPRLPLS